MKRGIRRRRSLSSTFNGSRVQTSCGLVHLIARFEMSGLQRGDRFLGYCSPMTSDIIGHLHFCLYSIWSLSSRSYTFETGEELAQEPETPLLGFLRVKGQSWSLSGNEELSERAYRGNDNRCCFNELCSAENETQRTYRSRIPRSTKGTACQCHHSALELLNLELGRREQARQP